MIDSDSASVLSNLVCEPNAPVERPAGSRGIMKRWHAGPVEPVVRLALSLAALGFLGNSIKAYREARPLVEIVRCSGFIIATLSWLLVSIFPHEPNAEFSGAPVAEG